MSGFRHGRPLRYFIRKRRILFWPQSYYGPLTVLLVSFVSPVVSAPLKLFRVIGVILEVLPELMKFGERLVGHPFLPGLCLGFFNISSIYFRRAIRVLRINILARTVSVRLSGAEEGAVRAPFLKGVGVTPQA